jgi:hypothetical protein
LLASGAVGAIIWTELANPGMPQHHIECMLTPYTHSGLKSD